MRVLLVDDEPRVVEGLERMLDAEFDDLHLETATSGREAMEALSDEPCDLVITDMRMPGMTGAELLEGVHERWPRVIRYVLSGQMEPDTWHRAWPHAHSFLSKPCALDVLVGAVEDAKRLRGRAADPLADELLPQALREDVPAWAARMVQTDDPALREKMERIATSRPWAEPVPGPSSSERWVLAVQHSVVTQLARLDEEAARRFDERSLQRAARCRAMLPTIEAFAVGLLADVGAAVLGAVGAEVDARADRVGASLLARWGLPGVLVEAVAHHGASECPAPSRKLALVLRVASALERNAEPDGATKEELGPELAAWMTRARTIELRRP